MSLNRAIGRWSLVALIVNTVIGSGVFGIPSELNGIVGRASPIAMILAGLGMAMVMACFAEVASQFSGAGGAYLYVKTALGDFAGMQVAWFSWLAPVGACAASANLFMVYLAGLVPFFGTGAGRIFALTMLIGALTIANYIGVRTGTEINNLFTVAKLLPLALLIILGLWHFARTPELLPASEIVQPGIRGWLDALLFVAFAYGGFENALIPAAEMKAPRKQIPIALATALLTCIAIYALVQFIVVVTIGTGAVERPLAAVSLVLIGSSGAAVVTVAAMISSYGSIAAMVLATPRLTFSMAQQGEFPSAFSAVHPRFHTPHISILVFGMLTLLLAATGTFRWGLMLASGAVIITYAAVCVSLIVLRRRNPTADALRIPAGPLLAVASVAVALILLSRLSRTEGLMLAITGVVATINHFAVHRARVGSAGAGYR
jgi:basic amino acid/polyamine antiporter, APA family